jgi:hypothetical protein
MKRDDFRYSEFVRQFFADLNRYLDQLKERPGRVITLDASDKARLEKAAMGEETPDYQHYRGVGLLWKTH